MKVRNTNARNSSGGEDIEITNALMDPIQIETAFAETPFTWNELFHVVLIMSTQEEEESLKFIDTKIRIGLVAANKYSRP